MAMAGNAVGLGNFLRFPGKVAPYGGAFMVPYFLALVLIGIPLMWMEWTIGRHGGGYGHGSTPGMFHRLWHARISKYLGIFGILLPAMVGLYYVYIESWSLGFAWQTATGAYWGTESVEGMGGVFKNYLGIGDKPLAFGPQAYVFFLITFALNIFVFSRGISRGIEVVAKYAMPALLVMGVILTVRVFTLPPVDGRSVSDGLALIWTVKDWSVLLDSGIWMAASGQVFFTLSVGLGMVHSYASYLKKKEDITLSGLTACATNEFVEVIIGGSIAIPAAVIFFGAVEARAIAEGGTFNIGFFALPVIFQQMPAGQFFGTLWFILLFLAGLTSSMAMFTPLLLFLEDELQMKRKKAVALIAAGVFLFMQPIMLCMHHGTIDEMDYWMGEFGLVLFAAIEVVIFAWVFGMDKGWEEMHLGADLQIPRVFYYIMKYVTPVFAVSLMLWAFLEPAGQGQPFGSRFWNIVTMQKVTEQSRPYLWMVRGVILATVAFLIWGVWYAWRTHPRYFEVVESDENGVASAAVVAPNCSGDSQ
jgi:SNF family Na+-dependent transporter